MILIWTALFRPLNAARVPIIIVPEVQWEQIDVNRWVWCENYDEIKPFNTVDVSITTHVAFDLKKKKTKIENGDMWTEKCSPGWQKKTHEYVVRRMVVC